MDWSAFGAIATSIACILALVPIFDSRFRYLKLSCKFNVVAFQPGTSFEEAVIQIRCHNVCNIAVQVQGFCFKVGKEYKQYILVPGNPYYIAFPHTVMPGESFLITVPKKTLIDSLNQNDKGKRIWLYVMDSFGKNYKLKCGVKADDLLALQDDKEGEHG